ncbi:MAG: glycosyltransferase [Cyanobacteria bacterium P01_F01_bin.86]
MDFIRFIKACALNARTFLRLLSIERFKNLIKVIFSGDAALKAQVYEYYINFLQHQRSESLRPKDISKVSRKIPRFSEIDVSIIIPVYNQWALTDDCIRSVIASVKDVRYEIILADDCSSDKTTQASSIYKNLKISRPLKNQGFLGNCNLAAMNAIGRYIVFLNNDTRVHEHWLEALYSKMEKDASIGVCGSKLVYPDGTLQEAGGIIWKDASGWNYGRNDLPTKPEYCYVKEVDYISGASIMVRSDLWQELNGFDDRYRPAYYEDTDLAFEARSRGYKVVFHPHSVVTHFEGKSHGTDESSGIKAYQAANKVKFEEKWAGVLSSDHFPNTESVFYARDKSANKRTILVIDHYIPWYDKDAGSRSTDMYLQFFCDQGYNVKFIGDNFFPHQPYLDRLNEMGVEVLVGPDYAKNWELWLMENGEYIDVVYLHRPHIAPKYLEKVRQHTNAKVIYQCHDLHFLRLQRAAESMQDKEKESEAEYWKQIELALFDSVDVGLTFSLDELAMLNNALPSSKVRQIPLFLYDQPELSASPRIMRENVMFVGGFQHTPNIEGILWFCKEVWPKVIARYPDLVFNIAGSGAPDEIRALQSNSINVLGFVDDEKLINLYQHSVISVLPLLHGAGVKGKLIESMQIGTPVVSTSIGIEGINASAFGLNGFDEPDSFTQEICKLVEDERHWRNVQSKLRRCFDANFNKRKLKDSLLEIF